MPVEVREYAVAQPDTASFSSSGKAATSYSPTSGGQNRFHYRFLLSYSLMASIEAGEVEQSPHSCHYCQAVTIGVSWIFNKLPDYNEQAIFHS
jgi:hypothetical protein